MYNQHQQIDGFFSNVGDKLKQFTQTVKEDVQAVTQHPVKTIALAPVRLAFDGLLRLNFRGFASRLKSAIAKNPTYVQSVAVDKLGYQWQNFVANVNIGAPKKPLLGTVSGYSVGVVLAASTITAIAAAAPAIVIIVKALEDLGLKEPADTQAVNTAIDQIQNSIPSYQQSNQQAPSGGGLLQMAKDNPIPTTIVIGGLGYGLLKVFKVIK